MYMEQCFMPVSLIHRKQDRHDENHTSNSGFIWICQQESSEYFELESGINHTVLTDLT